MKTVKPLSDEVNEQPDDSSVQKNPEEITTPEDDSVLTDQDKLDITAQAIREIQFARRYKQGKIRNWQKNEEMYYGKKTTTTESRANVDLSRMQEHVHTIMSKVDDPLMFRFSKRKESQLKRVQRLNALRKADATKDFWDIKDIVGKKQAIIYGRAAYVYYADSLNGYKPHLENIDIYDLLVDPSGGGIDVEQMLYWGRYGVIKSKEELKAGLESGDYDKFPTQELIDGSGNNTESSQEETNKFVRMYGQNTIGKKDLQTDEKYKFWQWFTTYKGTRYVLTLQAIAGKAIQIEPLSELFSSDLWPLWTYASFMDLTEFWTPSYCDYVRELFMTQNININQMLDNAEAINKPMKVVNVGALENLAELKYRRDGLIKTKGDFDANKVVQVLQTPSIETPIQVFNLLETIQEKASGVTAGDKGAATTDGRVAIYEGNQEAAAGRYGLFNKSYSFGYDRFAKLWQWGVREHLIKKTAIDIIGPDGIETIEVNRKDMFKKGDEFTVIVEASNADMSASTQQQTVKINFLDNEANLQAPLPVKIFNAKKAFEIKAKIAGFTEDEIKELMDTDDYGSQEILSEAARDIESILEGEDIKPNAAANNAYKQHFVDFLVDHKEDMDDKTWKKMTEYIKSLDQVIYANEASRLLREKTNMMNAQTSATANQNLMNPTPTPPAPGTGAPPMMPLNKITG